MDDKPLTITQKKVLRFIGEYIAENGFSPSITEICEATGMSSTSSAHHQLTALERLGRITRMGSRGRTIKVTQEGDVVSKRHEVSKRIRAACAEVVESRRELEEAREQTEAIRLRLLDYYARWGIELAEQNKALIQAAQKMDQLSERLDAILPDKQ